MTQKDTRIKEEIPFQPSTIETVDYAVFDYIKEHLNISAQTNRGFETVPVIWVSAERAYITKRRREERDKGGTVNYPLIVVEREGFVKDPARKGTAYANIPHEPDAQGGAASIQIARRIQQRKSKNFINAEAKRRFGQLNFPMHSDKVVYQSISIPMPVYIVATYRIKLKANYQEQMNDMVQPFTNETGGINYFIAKHEGHRFEGFIQPDFAHDNSVGSMGDEERKYETEIKIEVLAYLIGKGKNDEQPKVVIRENAVEVRIPRERIVYDDSPEFRQSNGRFVGITSLGGSGRGGQD